MTESRAIELLTKWIRILHLESWDIRFEWCVPKGCMVKEGESCVSFLHQSHQAIVQMMDPEGYSNDYFEYNYEKNLVHELLHLRFADLDDSGDPLRDKLTHQLIDDLAWAFVKSGEERAHTEVE